MHIGHAVQNLHGTHPLASKKMNKESVLNTYLHKSICSAYNNVRSPQEGSTAGANSPEIVA
eukprot:121624-Pelagomonas_calceolata.AAC.1